MPPPRGALRAAAALLLLAVAGGQSPDSRTLARSWLKKHGHKAASPDARWFRSPGVALDGPTGECETQWPCCDHGQAHVFHQLVNSGTPGSFAITADRSVVDEDLLSDVTLRIVDHQSVRFSGVPGQPEPVSWGALPNSYSVTSGGTLALSLLTTRGEIEIGDGAASLAMSECVLEGRLRLLSAVSAVTLDYVTPLAPIEATAAATLSIGGSNFRETRITFGQLGRVRLSQSVLSHWSDWLVGFAAALAVAIPPTAETCIPPDAASDCVTGYLPGTPESPSQTCPPGCILTHATPPSASLFVLDGIVVHDANGDYVGQFTGGEDSTMVCLPGWFGASCDEDIDECLVADGGCVDPRYTSVQCVNTPGSHHCECRTGFVSENANNTRCADVDECAADNGGCEDSCFNTPGEFYCRCEGWSVLAPDGLSCLCKDYDTLVRATIPDLNNPTLYPQPCKTLAQTDSCDWLLDYGLPYQACGCECAAHTGSAFVGEGPPEPEPEPEPEP